MGNANRVKQQFVNDPRCTQCNAAEETSLHILRDYKAAREVWRNVGGPTREPNLESKICRSDPVKLFILQMECKLTRYGQLIFPSLFGGSGNGEIM